MSPLWGFYLLRIRDPGRCPGLSKVAPVGQIPGVERLGYRRASLRDGVSAEGERCDSFGVVRWYAGYLLGAAN
jgi:hypothetical protein